MSTDRRGNQDKYDVIQARQEYESMHLPFHEEVADGEGEFVEPDFDTVNNEQGSPVSVLTLDDLAAKMDELSSKYDELKNRLATLEDK